MVFLAISRDLGACPSRGEAAQKRICALWSEPRRTYPSPATWMVNRKWRKVAVFWSWRIIFFFFFYCWCRPEAAQNLTPFPFFSLLSCLFVSLFLPIDTTRAWLSESLVKELLSISRLIFFLTLFRWSVNVVAIPLTDTILFSSDTQRMTRGLLPAAFLQMLSFFPLLPLSYTDSLDRSLASRLLNQWTNGLGIDSWPCKLVVISFWGGRDSLRMEEATKKNRRQHLASRWSFADDETTQWRGSSSLAIAQNHYRALHRVVWDRGANRPNRRELTGWWKDPDAKIFSIAK